MLDPGPEILTQFHRRDAEDPSRWTQFPARLAQGLCDQGATKFLLQDSPGAFVLGSFIRSGSDQICDPRPVHLDQGSAGEGNLRDSEALTIGFTPDIVDPRKNLGIDNRSGSQVNTESNYIL